MPDLSAVTTNFFPVASETYSNNLSASIAALAATVPVNANNTYVDGDICVITVEPGTANQATFRGTKASSPARFINCAWTEGNLGVGHALGAVVADYDTATTPSMITKGIKKFANDDGTLITAAVQAALNQGSVALNGWNALGYAPAVVTALGNRSYTFQINGIDLTTTLSPGMRLRAQRTVAAPTQCSLLNGINQYWSKAAPNGMTFTDDFAAGAWVKISSYGSAAILSRYNGTSGWAFYLSTEGRVVLQGNNAGGGNFSNVTSYQSIPLNKWVHISAQLDMSAFTATSTTSYVMIDGVEVPSTVSRGGTNPTALVQPSDDLRVGFVSGVGYLPGKIAQAFVTSAKITQTQARSIYSQGLTGSEPGMVSAYSFNGNANDLVVANGNNLTSNGGVTATTADSPFGVQGDGSVNSLLDYGIIMQGVFAGGNTTFTVQVPEGNTMSTTGISALAYSSNKVPFGFPDAPDRWRLLAMFKTNVTTAVFNQNVWSNPTGAFLQFPTGIYKEIGYETDLNTSNSSGGVGSTSTLSTVNNATTDPQYDVFSESSATYAAVPRHRGKPQNLNTPTTFYLNVRTTTINTTSISLRGDQSVVMIYGDPQL